MVKLGSVGLISTAVRQYEKLMIKGISVKLQAASSWRAAEADLHCCVDAKKAVIPVAETCF